MLSVVTLPDHYPRQRNDFLSRSMERRAGRQGFAHCWDVYGLPLFSSCLAFAVHYIGQHRVIIDQASSREKWMDFRVFMQQMLVLIIPLCLAVSCLSFVSHLLCPLAAHLSHFHPKFLDYRAVVGLAGSISKSIGTAVKHGR